MNQLHDELLTAHKAYLGWSSGVLQQSFRDDPANRRWHLFARVAKHTARLLLPVVQGKCQCWLGISEKDFSWKCSSSGWSRWQGTTYVIQTSSETWMDLWSHGLGDTKPFWCGGSAAADVCPVPLQHLIQQIVSLEMVLWASMKMANPKGFH